MEIRETRLHWPRLTLTLPPDTRDALHELARANFRDPKREATRLLVEAIRREATGSVTARR